MLFFIIGGYVGIALYLGWATMQWHVDHGSPTTAMLHDLLIAAVWPVEVVVRIWRAHR